MKHSSLRSRSFKSSGFTLVELLVVIGIIAILASVLVVSAGSAIRAAERAKANNTSNQIQTAVLNYYTEYSVYPLPPNTSTDYQILANDDPDWGNLSIALSGNINPYNPGTTATSTISNTRAIAFLNLKKSDVDAAGSPLNPIPPDTQHLYFNIAIDGNYDGVIGADGVTQLPNFSTSKLGSMVLSGGTSTAGVAVWADGNGNTTSQNPNFWVHTY